MKITEARWAEMDILRLEDEDGFTAALNRLPGETQAETLQRYALGQRTKASELIRRAERCEAAIKQLEK